MQRVIDYYVSELREHFGEKILGVYLFGSAANGTATSESDIDVLIVYSNIDERNLLRILSILSKMTLDGSIGEWREEYQIRHEDAYGRQGKSVKL